MDKNEVKVIEEQIKELQTQVRDYYKKETASEIRKVEDKYVGRMYKKCDQLGHYTYIKVLSAVTGNAPNQVICFEFEYPLDVKFVHSSHYRLYASAGKDPFAYGFDGEPFAWIDEEFIKELDKVMLYEEVSMRDWQNAYQAFSNKVLEYFSQSFKLTDVLGEEYEE